METKLFHLKPWTPRIREAAQKLIDEIHAVAPELETLFMGAAALGLPGKNDIDLDICCSKDDIVRYTPILNMILGEPREVKDSLVAWTSEIDGFEIDAILSDPATSHVPAQQKDFEKLKSNSELLSEYQILKQQCDGLPYTEYEKRKDSFFKRRVR